MQHFFTKKPQNFYLLHNDYMSCPDTGNFFRHFFYFV